jgi:hypothetical protein
MFIAYLIVTTTMFVKYIKQKGIVTICEQVLLSTIGFIGLANLPLVVEYFSTLIFDTGPLRGIATILRVLINLFWWGD